MDATPAGRPRGRWRWTAAVCALVVFCSLLEGRAARAAFAPGYVNFTDTFATIDPSRWHVVNNIPPNVYDLYNCPGAAVGGCPAANVSAGGNPSALTLAVPYAASSTPSYSGGMLVSQEQFQLGTFTSRMAVGPNPQPIYAMFLFDFVTQDEIDVELTYGNVAHDGCGPGAPSIPATNQWMVWFTICHAANCTYHWETPFASLGLDPALPHTYQLGWFPDHISLSVDGRQAITTPTSVLSQQMRLVLNAWLPRWKLDATPSAADTQPSALTVSSVTVDGQMPWLPVAATAVRAGATGSTSVGDPVANEVGVSASFTNNAVPNSPTDVPKSVVVAEYASDPVPNVSFDTGGFWEDLRIPNASLSDSATARFYSPDADIDDDSYVLQYFDGSAWQPVLSSNGATSPATPPVVRDGVDTPGAETSDSFSVSFDRYSSPRIDQLGGTVFGIGRLPDHTPPTTTATTAPTDPQQPGVAVDLTSLVVTPRGQQSGQELGPLTCWTTSGVTASLKAVDNAGGSGVARLTYSASGAQPIAATTVAGDSATIRVTQEGLTTLSYAASDRAGNQEAPQHLTIVLFDGRAGVPSIGCAIPASGISLPAHGRVRASGTLHLTNRDGRSLTLPLRLSFSY
jgi:hypothetical protein